MTQVFVPRESVNDQSVLVQKILIASGAAAAANQVVVEIETSKTVLEVLAPEAGLVTHALREGEEVEVGALLFTINASGTQAPTPATPPIASVAMPTAAPELLPSPAPVEASTKAPVLSRAAEAFARARNLPLEVFAGHWVTRADLERGRPAETRDDHRKSLRAPMPPAASAPQRAADTSALPTFVAKSNSMRKRAEIENLTKGRHAETASTIGIRVELPGSRIVAADFLFRDSISDLVVFEGARLLRKYPELNGLHLDDRRSGHYEAVDFGISFDDVQNLKVLTLRSADTLTLPALHREFSSLLDLFESKKAIPPELLGTSTVTLTDLSTTGASFMLPLLNGLQSLIIGVVKHSSREFELLATFDHRVSEGLRVTRFLEELRDRIVSHYRDEHGNAKLACGICGKRMEDEVRLGNRGMMNMTLPSGKMIMMCRNCFEGR